MLIVNTKWNSFVNESQCECAIAVGRGRESAGTTFNLDLEVMVRNDVHPPRPKTAGSDPSIIA